MYACPTPLPGQSLSNRLLCAITQYVLSVPCVRLERVEGVLPFRFSFRSSSVKVDIILVFLSAYNKLISYHHTITISCEHRQTQNEDDVLLCQPQALLLLGHLPQSGLTRRADHRVPGSIPEFDSSYMRLTDGEQTI